MFKSKKVKTDIKENDFWNARQLFGDYYRPRSIKRVEFRLALDANSFLPLPLRLLQHRETLGNLIPLSRGLFLSTLKYLTYVSVEREAVPS